ncbi:MAG: hypothetical protein IT384_19685 [Deltaproteobacteria bacterium]|nr:hypothetical protein [Deltaproteobacteria bacterium]
MTKFPKGFDPKKVGTFPTTELQQSTQVGKTGKTKGVVGDQIAPHLRGRRGTKNLATLALDGACEVAERYYGDVASSRKGRMIQLPTAQQGSPELELKVNEAYRELRDFGFSRDEARQMVLSGAVYFGSGSTH